MPDDTDAGYDEATRRNDGRGAIPFEKTADLKDQESDESTEDNPLDDVHSVDDMAERLDTTPKAQAADINSRDNEAEWSREE